MIWVIIGRRTCFVRARICLPNFAPLSPAGLFSVKFRDIYTYVTLAYRRISLHNTVQLRRNGVRIIFTIFLCDDMSAVDSIAAYRLLQQTILRELMRRIYATRFISVSRYSLAIAR